MNLNQLINSKQYDKAIKECKALIADAELDGDLSAKLTGLVYLGIIFTQQGFFYKSKKIFDDNFEDIVLECKHYWNGKELTDTYLHYNKIDKAVTYNLAYLEQNPNDERALLTRSHLQYLKADYMNALKTINALENLNTQAYYLTGLIQLKLRQNKQAFHSFEKAFDLGYEKSINEIFKLLFIRSGSCDFKNCTDCCCKGVLLKGIDGETIKNEDSFNLILLNDSRNSCWRKDKTNSKGQWVFECDNLEIKNYCRDYENRPETCRDYPSSILNSRPACSYKFELNNQILFSSKNTLKIVLHILKAYRYNDEMNQLIKSNKTLLS